MEAIICDYENGKETETRYIIDLWEKLYYYSAKET